MSIICIECFELSKSIRHHNAAIGFANRSEQLETVHAANDAAVQRSDLNQRWSIVTFVTPQTQTQMECIIILACFEVANRFFSANRPGGQTAKSFEPLVNETTKIMTTKI